ncbi:MAG: FAD-binding protein [Candidatus Bathyarchaeia archaeon]
MVKVIIVGAGPAGLFAAHELAGFCDVTILEERDHVGGSGLYSDGKLNFHPRIGGDITQFISEDDAWMLISYIKQIFSGLGVELHPPDEIGVRNLEAKAIKAGMRFVRIEQSHIGSDHLPSVIGRMRSMLEKKGVEFRLGVRVRDLILDSGRIKGVETTEGVYPADAFLLAPGRIGSNWLVVLMKRLGVEMSYNPLDIGVRVEVPNEVFEEIIQGYRCWDPKFHIHTPSYDDFSRTFCVCPRGYVFKEAYDEEVFGVNGHSMRERESPNTNFALLVRISLTEPLENTTEYGRRIAQLANTLGGRRPILQRLGDLRGHRRSTWERIERSYVEPTLRDVTPGDISMAYPSRIVRDLLEALEILDRVAPGVNTDSTLIYAPEIKFYAMRIETDNQLRTTIPNLYVAGDGAGVSRGIIGAAATGIIAARGIKAALSKPNRS